MLVEEKTIDSERVYEGSVINLRRDRVSLGEGKTSWREIVEHRGGVTIAALTDEGKMLMVKQFRKSAESFMLEAPAGKIDEGETDPLRAAARELREETGYAAEKLEHLMSFYSSVGYSTELLHLYLATGLRSGETDFDENEFIENFEYTPDELMGMIERGEIEDAKTIIAVQAVKLRGY
jgi:ADP-ribose pyrophosphatase